MLISKCLSWDLGVGIWGEFGICVVQEGKDCVVGIWIKNGPFHSEIKMPIDFFGFQVKSVSLTY